jgi:hypothetical protein
VAPPLCCARLDTAKGKLTASEAEALLDAISRDRETRSLSMGTGPHATSAPKFLRVLVDGEENEKPNKVNVRIPLDLIRAGMRLAALLPCPYLLRVTPLLQPQDSMSRG